MRLSALAAGAVGMLIPAFGCATLPRAVPSVEQDAMVVRGVVFHDRDGDGRRDPGEPGLGGVCVSNGRAVAVTDRHGYYELPVEDEMVVFVIKPTNWRPPIDRLNLPRFYYVHRPKGSPELEYPGLAPTGPLPASVDFALYPQPEPHRFSVILLADTQPRDLQEVNYVARDVVSELVDIDAALVFLLGDLVFDDLALHEPLNQVMAQIGRPVYNVLGNHDMNYDAADDRYAAESFSATYGPPYYALNCGPVHFVVLDDVVWEGGGAEHSGNYHAGLGQRQLEFLRNDLRQVPADRLVVLLMHIPIMQIAERAELYALLAERPHVVSFSGHEHVHRQWYLGAADGWPAPWPHHHTTIVAACGSWWSGAPDELGIPHTTQRDGTPNGWCLVDFDGNDYQVSFRAARRPATYQMNIYVPDELGIAEIGQTEVLVNVFAGSERSAVYLRVDAGEWVELQRVERVDPQYQVLYDAYQADPPPAGRKLSRPAVSAHVWSGVLPSGLHAGGHLLTVRSVDQWGRSTTARRIIRVVGDRQAESVNQACGG